MPELPDDIYAAITQLSEEGDNDAEAEKFDAALVKYNAALALLPEPREKWSAHLWLLAAIGDAYFLQQKFDLGRDCFRDALFLHEDALDNGFIHMRYGQCLFELGDLSRAGEELMLAYMGEGPEIFEDEDPKYVNYLSTIALDIQTSKPAKTLS